MNDDDADGEGWITIYTGYPGHGQAVCELSMGVQGPCGHPGPTGDRYVIDVHLPGQPPAIPFIDRLLHEAEVQRETRQGELRLLERDMAEGRREFESLLAMLHARRQDDPPRAGVKPAISGLLTTAPADHRLGRFR